MARIDTNQDTGNSRADHYGNQAIARRVRAALDASQCTNTELAEALGVSRSTIERRLRGDRAFTATDVGVIAHRLGVSAGELLGLDPAHA